MRVIAVVGMKGGGGKTSTAVPLAYNASRTGRTILLDLDEKTPSASQWINAAGLHDRISLERLSALDLEDRLNAIEAEGVADWVVIDTPPGSGDVVMLAAGQSDVVLVPIHIGSGDVAQAEENEKLLRMPLRLRPSLQIRAVLNHAGIPTVTRDTRIEVEAAGLRVAEAEVPYLKIYSLAKGTRPTVDWWHHEKLWAEVQGLLK